MAGTTFDQLWLWTLFVSTPDSSCDNPETGQTAAPCQPSFQIKSNFKTFSGKKP